VNLQNPSMEANAYHFVDLVFHHPQGGPAELLRLAEHAERDWIEFKAALVPVKSESTSNHQRKDAYSWNLAKALIAMANTHGGLVFLGLDNDCNPVSLEKNDPRNFLANEGQDFHAESDRAQDFSREREVASDRQ